MATGTSFSVLLWGENSMDYRVRNQNSACLTFSIGLEQTDGELSLLHAPGWGEGLCHFSHTTHAGKTEGQPILGLGFVQGKGCITLSQEKVLGIHSLEVPWKI